MHQLKEKRKGAQGWKEEQTSKHRKDEGKDGKDAENARKKLARKRNDP